MKREFLLLIALSTILSIQVNAAIPSSQLTDSEYLYNNGYSEATAEEVLISKNRSLGKPAEPIYEKNYSRFTRFWRNVYGYIDPAQDTDERIHHDIHMSPNARDL